MKKHRFSSWLSPIDLFGSVGFSYVLSSTISPEFWCLIVFFANLDAVRCPYCNKFGLKGIRSQRTQESAKNAATPWNGPKIQKIIKKVLDITH